MKKADFILSAILVLIGVYSMFIFSSIPHGNTVKITMDGKTLYEGDITYDTIIYAQGRYNNKVVIADGKVHIQDSNCPGKYCEAAGSIDNGIIACAPNGVVVSIVGNENKSEVDVIAN